MSLNLSLATNKAAISLAEEFERKGGEILLGKEETIRLSLCSFLAQGHLLIEDIPGVGKTTLVKFLAKAIDLEFNRIQFTSDLLPSDILGISIFDSKDQIFRFHKGPIFGQLILGDELNRATPKTQSAFLQAMEERHITIDGQTHQLPNPFFLVATQNPRQQIGTYPLPESQLDRFLMRLTLGYPNREAEKALLSGAPRKSLIENLKPILSISELIDIQKVVQNIFCSESIIIYVQDILNASRTQFDDSIGLSPRAGLDILRAARAWAFLDGRDMVLPEDIQAIVVSVTNHRILVNQPLKQSLDRAKDLIRSVRLN